MLISHFQDVALFILLNETDFKKIDQTASERKLYLAFILPFKIAISIHYKIHKILSILFNHFWYIYKVVQPSPQSSFRTFPSFQKVPPCHLQSVPTPTPTPRPLLICFLFCLSLNFHENGFMQDTFFCIWCFLHFQWFWDWSVSLQGSVVSWIFLLNSNYLNRYTRLWTCGSFWVLSIMNNAVIHSSVSFPVDIWFYFSWLLGSCWVIEQVIMCVCVWGRGW